MTVPALPSVIIDPFERLQALDRRAVAELEEVSREVLAILDEQEEACADAPGPEPESIAGVRALRAQTLDRCLVSPLESLDRAAAIRRARAALDLHERTVRTWARLLPGTVQLSGKEAVALAERWEARSPWSRIARWMGRSRPVPLRAIAAEVAARLDAERAEAEAACVTALATVIGQAGRSWGATRVALDATTDWSLGPRAVERARRRAAAGRARVDAELEKALAERRDWLSDRFLPALGAALVTSVLRRGRGSAAVPRPRPVPETAPHDDAEAVRSELGLERGLEEATAGLLAGLDRAISAEMEEDAALDAELERLVALLPRLLEEPGEPLVEVDVTPAAARLAELDRAATAEAEKLPGRATLGGRGSSYGRQRTVRPARILQAAYHETIRPSCAALFQAIEAEHREVSGDLERACQVVAFAAEAVRSADATPEVAREAVEHAVALLEFRRSGESRTTDGMRAAAVVCRALRDARVALFGGRTERWTHRARRELERGVPAATAALAVGATRQLRTVGGTARRATHRFLERIGWRPDSSGGASEISIRPLLPGEFSGDPADPELPSLYRHLFRPDPVKDPRLLVGRAPELAAIADARARWEAGHTAAVLVTGERGSGKTSLINCALGGPLQGLQVLRGEFNQRLLDPAALAPAIAAIVGAPDPDRLEEYLGESRRVVVIEEVERTFLRHVGHYEAARALGRLISATSGTVLWIVVVNQIAFRFLDAAIGLGHRFSHRIYAGTATAEEIRQAILVRHNLSGLRLRYERAPDTGRPPRGLTDRRRARTDPERAFFEMVARQSGGVYRTAFSIWLGHIALIEDGLFTVKAPAAHDLAPVIAGLTLTDLFSVVALMQHGSLTAAEHALVFQQSVEASDAQIDELVARQIIGRDPIRPGYRVRPEAMSAVREALFRRNLL